MFNKTRYHLRNLKLYKKEIKTHTFYLFIIGLLLWAFLWFIPTTSALVEDIKQPLTSSQNDGLVLGVVTHAKHSEPIVTEARTPISSTIREVTAYNVGVVAQNDASPCISANGENICLAVERGYKRCAANFVPFGTRLYVEGFGECLVTDRMNSRYQNRVDVAMSKDEIDRAVKFGLQHLTVDILSDEKNIQTEN